MIKEIIIVICLVMGYALSAVILLKCLYAFIKKNRDEQREKYFNELNLIDKRPSYEKYDIIARKVSVRNTTVRSSGDFWDFIMPCIRKSEKDCVENNIYSNDRED